jgi:hypothetical protein
MSDLSPQCATQRTSADAVISTARRWRDAEHTTGGLAEPALPPIGTSQLLVRMLLAARQLSKWRARNDSNVRPSDS